MLLRQNSELRKDHIFNWSLPAWVTRLPDGRTLNVCPEAGSCAKLCYARTGTYRFPTVLASHTRNLELTLDRPGDFIRDMCAELGSRRFRATGSPRIVDGLPGTGHLHPDVQKLLETGAPVVRIHDSGDFYSEDYLDCWLEIAWRNPRVLFYCYTKSVSLFRAVIGWPTNFLWCYSLGGREDHLLDLSFDRHAEVFPTVEALHAAGYFDQEANDLLCVLAPDHRIGIVANRIPHLRRAQGTRTFGELESALTRHRRTR